MIGFTSTCPVTVEGILKEKQLKPEEPCQGLRKDGCLKNYCASCQHYKKYVELKFPNTVKHK